MSRSRRGRIGSLTTRAEHLRRRIEEARRVGKDMTWDKAELMALEWALPVLEGHVEANRVLHEQLAGEKKDDGG